MRPTSRRPKTGFWCSNDSNHENALQVIHRLTTALFLASLTARPFAPAADTPPIDELPAKAAEGDTRAQVSLAVRYRDGKMFVRWVMTHREYDDWCKLYRKGKV